jgi:hypothetical protein
MQSVLTAKSLDIETTLITNPKLNKSKQLSAGIINSKTRSAVYIETPYLINPFGISSYDGGKTITEEQRTYSLSLKAAGGQNENLEEIQALFNYLKELDEKAIDYGLEHSQQIFKKKYEESQRSILVDLLYNRCVKPSVSTDGTVYPDKITLKVMKNEQMKPDVLVFKDSPTPLEINSWDDLQNIVPKGTAIKAIMQPRLYFVNGKMGINFRVLQIKLPNFEKVGRPITYAFSEIPSETIVPTEQVKALSLTDSKKETDPTKTTDSEEEVDDEEEEEDDEDSEVEVEEN